MLRNGGCEASNRRIGNREDRSYAPHTGRLRLVCVATGAPTPLSAAAAVTTIFEGFSANPLIWPSNRLRNSEISGLSITLTVFILN